MAEVRLVDIYEPLTFNAAVQERAIELNAFASAGIIVQDPRIDAMVAQGGMIGELPFFLNLDNNEPDYTSDDPSLTNTPDKISSAVQIFRLANQAKSWSTMDLSRQLALQDPLGAITNRIAHYWATNLSQRIISTTVGLRADNVANNGGDMVVDISIEDGDNAVAANLISAEAVIDAAATLGDHSQEIAVLAVHSVVRTRLRKQNLIDFTEDSNGNIRFETYLGYRLVEDDALTVEAGGTSGFKFTSVLFAPGAFGYGESAPLVPSELDRKPESGNGGGQDILFARRNEIIHPAGFAFASAGIAQGVSATRANLQDPAQWSRVYEERKNIPMAFLITNG
jgi:hypothetical protein